MATATPRLSHPVLRPRRIGVCGGGKLTPENVRFCERLGWELAGEPGLVLVTGGFRCHRRDAQGPISSTDWSVVTGVRARLRQDGVAESECVETLLPDFDEPQYLRFEAGQTLRLHKRSPQARRCTLVNSTDALVSIQGESGTYNMLDLALAMEKPCLPLPFTGGASAQRWQENRDQIREWFYLDDATLQQLERPQLAAMSPEDMGRLSAFVKEILLRRLRKKCFVIMPFAPEFQSLYEQGIKPALLKRGLNPMKADQLNLIGNAVEILRNAIIVSDCAVAVLTGFNPNVLYELGLAHGESKPVVLLCRRLDGEGSLPQLPFDLRNEFVLGYDDDLDELRTNLGAILEQLGC